MVPNARSLLYRYLLGELTNEEARKIEERARTDDGYGKRLRGTECELFAAYVSGDLTLGARERFENYFLRSGERVEKLSLAKLLYGRAKTGGARFPDAGDPFYVYFLGDLTTEERRKIEERCFVDDNYRELLRVAECELCTHRAHR